MIGEHLALLQFKFLEILKILESWWQL